jgi:hypothetical protein
MNRLERFMWTIRGNASRLVVEEYDDLADAILFPVMGWVSAAAVAYLIVDAAPYSTAGDLAVVAIALFVLVAIGWGAVEWTLAAKYYLTEWTEDVRRPEVLR